MCEARGWRYRDMRWAAIFPRWVIWRCRGWCRWKIGFRLSLLSTPPDWADPHQCTRGGVLCAWIMSAYNPTAVLCACHCSPTLLLTRKPLAPNTPFRAALARCLHNNRSLCLPTSASGFEVRLYANDQSTGCSWRLRQTLAVSPRGDTGATVSHTRSS